MDDLELTFSQKYGFSFAYKYGLYPVPTGTSEGSNRAASGEYMRHKELALKAVKGIPTHSLEYGIVQQMMKPVETCEQARTFLLTSPHVHKYNREYDPVPGHSLLLSQLAALSLVLSKAKTYGI